jgi:hypothetical protein
VGTYAATRGSSDDQLLNLMLRHPILINCPIVETPCGPQLCRPPKLIVDLLANPIAFFSKEDGELVNFPFRGGASQVPRRQTLACSTILGLSEWQLRLNGA